MRRLMYFELSRSLVVTSAILMPLAMYRAKAKHTWRPKLSLPTGSRG